MGRVRGAQAGISQRTEGRGLDLDTRIANLVAATARGTVIEQEMLRTGVLAMGVPLTANPGTSKPQTVILETRRTTYFKRFRDQVPRLYQAYKQDRYAPPLNEVVAWRLAHAMGDPWDQLVPTAVLRKIDGLGGALVNHKDGIVDYHVLQQAKRQVAAAAFWDALIGNQDRNMRNFRYDADAKRLGLIDHGFCFARPGDPINGGSFFLEQRRRDNQVGLLQTELSAIEQLLDTGDAHGLRAFLPADRVDALEERARVMYAKRCLPLPGAF